MQELGLLDKWIAKFQPNPRECLQKKTRHTVKNLTTSDLLGAFVILQFGMAFAISAFICEHTFYRKKISTLFCSWTTNSSPRKKLLILHLPVGFQQFTQDLNTHLLPLVIYHETKNWNTKNLTDRSRECTCFSLEQDRRLLPTSRPIIQNRQDLTQKFALINHCLLSLYIKI